MADPALAKKIKANYDFLTENTSDVYSLVERLSRKSVLTNTQKAKVLDENENPNDQLKAAQLYYFISKSKKAETIKDLLKALIKTENYEIAFKLEQEALTKYFCSEAGGSRAKEIKLQNYHKKYLTHLEIVDSTIDIRSFVKDISDIAVLEKIRLNNVRADHVKHCDSGNSSSVLEHPAILKNLVHFECNLWFESNDAQRYGPFIWPQEIYKLDPNKIIFFRKAANEKHSSLEDRLNNFFGVNYLELTVNNQVLVLAIKDQNLAITPTLDGQKGKYFLPPTVISELKGLLENGEPSAKEFIANIDILENLIPVKHLMALRSAVCKQNQALQLRLLLSLLTWINPEELLKLRLNSRMSGILRKTMLTITGSDVDGDQRQSLDLIPTLQQSAVLTHVHFKNLKIQHGGFSFSEAFKNCTYLQSIIMERIQRENEPQFHIYLANLRRFHLSQNVVFDSKCTNIVSYLRQSRVGDWREMLFCEESLHYSDEYLDGRRLLSADIRLMLNGYILAFTDSNHRIHVISAEAENRDIVDKPEHYPNVEDCCVQTVNLNLLLERLRQNKFFSLREESAIQNCPDDLELKARLLYSIQAFTLRETSVFVECLMATGNETVANLFRPTTLEVLNMPFEGIPAYRQPFLTHLTLKDVHIDWPNLPSMLSPCVALQSLKMENVDMSYQEHIVGRCVFPVLTSFVFDGSIFLNTAAELLALLFFDKIPGRIWRMDELWLLGVDIKLVVKGVTYLSVDHAKAELTIQHLQHSADDIFKSVNVQLTKLTLASVKLQIPGFVPRTQALKALSLHQFELPNLDRFLAACPQLNDFTCGLPSTLDFQKSWHQVKELRKLDLAVLPRSLNSLTLLATELTLSSKTKIKNVSPIVVNNLYIWACELNKKLEHLEKHLQAVNCFVFENGLSTTRAPTSPKMLSALLSSEKVRRVFYSRLDGYVYDKKFAAYLKQFGLKGDERCFILAKSDSGQWTTEIVSQNRQIEAVKTYIEELFEG